MPAHIKALGQAEEHTYEGVVEASQPPAALPSPPAPRPPPNRSLEFDAQVDPPADAAAAAPAQEEQPLQITVELQAKVADWRRRIESAQEAPDKAFDFKAQLGEEMAAAEECNDQLRLHPAAAETQRQQL